jgi:hypothetical protein
MAPPSRPRRLALLLLLLPAAGAAAISWTLGAPSLPPLPAALASDASFAFPGSAFASLGDGDGKSQLLLYTAGGATYRVVGAPPFPAGAPSPTTPVLSAGPSGAIDASGNWLVAAFRTGASSLLGFTRAESAEFNCSAAPPGVAWRTGAIVTSDDDGASWSRRGAAILDDMPCSPHAGGSAFASVLPNGSGYLAWGGCTAYRSLDSGAAVGSWFRWFDGHFGAGFSEPGIEGMSSCLQGLPYGAMNPSVSFNAFLNSYVMVLSVQGDAQTLWIAVSTDGVQAWSAPAVLLRVAPPATLAWGSLVGSSNASVSERVATLVYAATPPTGKRSVDWVARSLTFLR